MVRTRNPTGEGRLPRTTRGSRVNGTDKLKFTIQNAFDAFQSYTDWVPNTRKQYSRRLLKVIRLLNPAWTELHEADLLDVDIIPHLNNSGNIKKVTERITSDSRVTGTAKDYMQAISSLAKKASPQGFGTLMSEESLRYVNQIVKNKKDERHVADVHRTFTEDDHEPYTNIQAAGKWYKDNKLITQHALIVSLYADNPVIVRDNYGRVKMYYGESLNRTHKVPAVNLERDTYYDVNKGEIFITEFKNIKAGHRPYDIKLDKHTKAIIDQQLKKARDEGDMRYGYRHWLIYQDTVRKSDPTVAQDKLGKNNEIDRALRAAKTVKFALPITKPIGPNVLRTSYVTWRLNRPNITRDEMHCLARDMRHSFVVQQTVYRRLNQGI